MFETMNLSALIMAVGGLTLCTNVITEVLKRIFAKLPPQLTATATALILTIAAVLGYASVNGIALTWYMIFGSVVGGFFVSYAAQFGFDKLKEMIKSFGEKV